MGDSESEKAGRDLVWWQEAIPKGWSVYGWTFKRGAALQSPTKRIIQVDGELGAQMHDDKKVVIDVLKEAKDQIARLLGQLGFEGDSADDTIMKIIAALGRLE